MAALVRHPPVAQSAPVLGQHLDEPDWTVALRQHHRYRCWAWRSPGLEVARNARSVALETLWDWQLGPLADDVTLCVSELITNAVMHGQPGGELEPVSLGLRYFPTACLFVEVADTSEAPPVIGQMADRRDASAELGLDGRGLLLVKRLSDHLWWRQVPGGGKTVYARLDTPRYFTPLMGGCRG